jgi:hypothetical protein
VDLHPQAAAGRAPGHDQLDGVAIPYRTQYAIKLESDVGVFVSYGRLDTAQPNFALVGLMGSAE